MINMTSTHGLKVCVPLQWPTDLSSSAAPPQTAQSLVQSSRLVWRLWQRRCRCCNVSREVENKPAVPWHPDLAPDPHTEAGVGDSPGHHRAVTHSHCPPITHSHCPPVTHSHCPPITPAHCPPITPTHIPMCQVPWHPSPTVRLSAVTHLVNTRLSKEALADPDSVIPKVR